MFADRKTESFDAIILATPANISGPLTCESSTKVSLPICSRFLTVRPSPSR